MNYNGVHPEEPEALSSPTCSAPEDTNPDLSLLAKLFTGPASPNSEGRYQDIPLHFGPALGGLEQAVQMCLQRR